MTKGDQRVIPKLEQDGGALRTSTLGASAVQISAMSCSEPYASGIVLYEDPQLISFTSMPSAQLPEPGLCLADYSMAALETAILCDGQEGGLVPGGRVAQPECYFFTGTPINDSRKESDFYDSTPPIPTSSFDSLVSDSSTFATTSSSAELGEDTTDDMGTIFEDINDNILWQPELLLPAYHEDNPYGASHCQAHESMCVANEDYHRHGIFGVEESLNKIPDSVDSNESVPPEASRSARTWPCSVRRVCACHPLRSKINMVKGMAKKGRARERKRMVENYKLTYPCEIRISKKLVPRDSKYLKGKAWLGTFATPDQYGRALDVGKYFLSTKKRKTFYDPNSAEILSPCRDRIDALPLAERVAAVIKLAKYYGDNGLLP